MFVLWRRARASPSPAVRQQLSLSLTLGLSWSHPVTPLTNGREGTQTRDFLHLPMVGYTAGHTSESLEISKRCRFQPAVPLPASIPKRDRNLGVQGGSKDSPFYTNSPGETETGIKNIVWHLFTWCWTTQGPCGFQRCPQYGQIPESIWASSWFEGVGGELVGGLL